MNLRVSLKQRALELGFDLVGIVPAIPGRDLEFAREWLDRGFAGEMDYLSNPKRFDPRAVLPSVRSVICLGLIYDTPFPYSTEVGSGQMAVGRKQEEGDRSQESEDKGIRSLDPQPSPPGSGWTREPGAGEGNAEPERVSSFDFRVSKLQFSVSLEKGGQDARAPRAWISRYAWGGDYHEVMREKLERLRAAIEELAPGAETRVYVDTGPVPERAYARLSGLGWMGKNTCIINEARGSFLFLGVVLTNLALEPDLPAPDRCGSCRACLDACPTGALVEPYVMDASRCISYLTIELKGSIPLELRSGVGVNIFGCDICQDVCPWNGKDRSQKPEARSQKADFEPMTIAPRKLETGNWKLENGNSKLENRNSKFDADQSGQAGTHPPPDIRIPSIQDPKSKIQNPSALKTFSLFNPPLEVLASMSEDDFRQTFRHSPIKRAKYRGWLRNLCVAMGNSGDARLAHKLKDLSRHADPLIREHADWALEQIRSRKS